MDNNSDKMKREAGEDNLSDKFEDDIKYSYKDLSDKLPLPPSNAFSRIMDKINIEEKREKSGISQSIFTRIFRFINDQVMTQKIGWALAGVQCAIIIFLVFSPSISNINSFKTLSVNTVPDKSVEINIVFKGNAMQKDIKELLNNSDAIIVDGPTDFGLYVLKVKQGDDLAVRLETLENSQIVKFVSKKY
jgi:hypothetical protein